jgi:hypothetical protein
LACWNPSPRRKPNANGAKRTLKTAETGEAHLPAAVTVDFDDERSARSHAQHRKQLLQLLYPPSAPVSMCFSPSGETPRR